MDKKKIKVNYNNLQTGDLVLTSGKGMFSYGIKLAIQSEVTHVGIVVDLYGKKVIAEMLTKGLVLSTFNRYTLSAKRDIIEVVRPQYLSIASRVRIRQTVLTDWIDKVDYDWGGVFKFIFKKSKNAEDKYFCSEYAAKLLNTELKCFKEEPKNIDPSELGSCNKNFHCVPIDWRL